MDENLLDRVFPELPDEVQLTPIEAIDRDIANFEYRISAEEEKLPKSEIRLLIGRYTLGSAVRDTLGHIRYYEEEIDKLKIERDMLKAECTDEDN